MKRELAIELRKEAKELAAFHSLPERKKMFTNEDWGLEQIYPLSDETAAVVFLKSGGKKAVAFYYLDGITGKKRWKHFFPSDAHLLGMEAFSKYKFEIEHSNFGFNFVKKNGGTEPPLPEP